MASHRSFPGGIKQRLSQTKIWAKNRGGPPKMDGLFHGKPYEQMDDLEVPLFLETPKYFNQQTFETLMVPFLPNRSPSFWLFSRLEHQKNMVIRVDVLPFSFWGT